MRFHLATIIVLGSLTTSTEQLPPLLDLTVPFDDGSKVVSGGINVTSTGVLPLTVAIVELPDQTYTVGEAFQYEVTITNNTPAALTIPWSPDPAWSSTAQPSGLLEASIGLALGSGSDRTGSFAGATMYGDSASLASVHVLASGASVRIRASGHWHVDVRGVKVRDYLAQRDGRVQVSARYHLTRGTQVGLTPVSEPRTVTLVTPQ